MDNLSLFTPKIDFVYTPVVNFALQQNHVPIVRSLVIENTTDQDLFNLIVEIVAEPDFALPYTQTLPFLKKGERYDFGAISLVILSKYLADLTERITGTITVRLKDGTRISELHYPIDLLAYDQWNGIALLPEMLSAFITPNHPGIVQIIRKASVVLEGWTGSPSFDEYQSRNPDRVRKQMAAIYETIAEMQLVYCSVPASFEESGQRIRLADAIIAHKLANCLDLSLLYAACLEAIGIRSIVVILKGHAFCGAWLIDETFSDAVNDDPSLITKRMVDGISEIAIVEATCMCAGRHHPFDEAVNIAVEKMNNTEDFVLFIDVKRSRYSGIRPLPLRIATSNGWEIEEASKTERLNVLPEDIYVGEQLLHADKIDVSKQQLWERKLLDLTLRNSLINLRVTKSVIQFITINAASLEDELAKGQEFQILAKPTDWDNSLRDMVIYKGINQSDPIADLVKHELSHHRIRTYLSEVELAASLTHIFRSSRLSMEENGANTLYVGLGLLRWYETEASERPRYAPILLIPIEIIRKTAQKGYVIRSREEEAIVNITLLEMLRQDFGIAIGGLESLPKDENGVDVKVVFNLIRQAIMNKSRWDVEEQAILGTFSFSKFILWNDIHHNSEQLCKNKVVASLVSGKLEWQVDGEDQGSEILDDQLHPASVSLPISTDSSQLQAIVSSGQNKSFVLHGPPGTGKSQTITNIIANALYAGKKVLFVAAKKAALEVVERRLESIGIGAFCLELHSNKSKKSDVLQQLKTAAEVPFKNSAENFEAESNRLFELRKELNVYVEALHKKYPFGYSLFDLFSHYGQIPDGDNKVYFPAAVMESLTAVDLISWNDLVEELEVNGKLIKHPFGHPLAAIQVYPYVQQIKQDARTLMEQLLGLLTTLEVQSDTVARVLHLQGTFISQEQENDLIKIVSLLLRLPDTSASIISAGEFEQTLAQLKGVAEHGEKRDLLRTGLCDQFDKTILAFPARKTLTEWNMASEQWFLPRYFNQNKIVKSLKVYSFSAKIAKSEVPEILNRLIEFQNEQEYLDKATYLPAVLGFLWRNGDCDWKNLLQICDGLLQMNRTAANLITPGSLKDWRLHFAGSIAEGSVFFVETNRSLFESYISLTEQVLKVQADLYKILHIDTVFLQKGLGNWRKDLIAGLNQWTIHLDFLKDWSGWLSVRERARQSGLQPLITAYESGNIKTELLKREYLRGFYRAAAEYIIGSVPELNTFNGTLFEDKIRKFREISKRFEILTRQELYAKLVSGIPSFTQEASQSSEIGFLQKAIRNNGRAMSIRKIFDSIPNLLHRLSPCMLMSPISVAQYFDANTEKFDLVIFDEASQMPTCEAVGAIARATNVIVVGDPKQMPPTNFFTVNNVDEENIDKEDLESILDDCLALSMPSQHLLWHYRSKHESLIAFSNAKYYDNKLLTFPSMDDLGSKVQFVQVAGYYDKGKTRQNRFEAKAIVNEVVRRLSDPLLAKKSMGIVTFSAVQQTLIEDNLNEVFSLRPDLEKIALECEEPIFIKNLENVQGDERDIILFSIGYGPDKDGTVSLNFGPLNREGGWRRLNVAVSRARYEMVVFSTLKAEQIDLNRTRSEGMAGLKAFLAYAELGKMALPGRVSSRPDWEPDFENLIAAELRKYGHEVHTQIGCSAYKIDLAIVNPEIPSQYILGILCDGKGYKSAKTSKDREIVQFEVLQMLGWDIHKIWSTEWWEKPEKVIAGILEAIDVAKAKAVVV